MLNSLSNLENYPVTSTSDCLSRASVIALILSDHPALGEAWGARLAKKLEEIQDAYWDLVEGQYDEN